MEAKSAASDIIFILDSSGSMSKMGDEVLQSVNQFITEQKALFGDDGTKFTFYTFNNVHVVVYDGLLSEMEPVTKYDPNGMTALYNVIETAINAKNVGGPKHDVICAILTDGEDNCSTITGSDINSLVTNMKSLYGWKFIYLGANQDAFKVGSSIGITRCCNFAPTMDGIHSAGIVLSRAISAQRSGYDDQAAGIVEMTSTGDVLPLVVVDFDPIEPTAAPKLTRS